MNLTQTPTTHSPQIARLHWVQPKRIVWEQSLPQSEHALSMSVLRASADSFTPWPPRGRGVLYLERDLDSLTGR